MIARSLAALALAATLAGCGLSREARDLVATQASGSRGILRQWGAMTEAQKRAAFELQARSWAAIDAEVNDAEAPK